MQFIKSIFIFSSLSVFVDGILSNPKVKSSVVTKTPQIIKSKFTEESKSLKYNRCPAYLDEEGSTMDRREAFFATIGSLIATMSLPSAVSAAYGQDAKIELPNPVESMSNRVSQQCLVESLGNRECLVYLDPANKLYQGADAQKLTEQIEKASASLATIPALIEDKKWSQVSGVLLGPLGTLSSTMEQLTKLSPNNQIAVDLAKKTKTDIYAIAQFAERKQSDNALAAHVQATGHLVAFFKAL